MSMNTKWHILFIVLAALMLFPCWFAASGTLHFMTSNSPTKNEGLHVVAYMAVYSSVLWLPYIVSLPILWRRLNGTVILITALPFLFMVVITTYGTLNGIPW